MSDEFDPIARFRELHAEAARSEVFDPGRAALATSSPLGVPSVRFVLVKGVQEGRFVVYTHLESPKARALSETKQAALAFHWSSLGVQVRVSGPTQRVAAQEADAYFASRPRGSQLGAWASPQSEPIASRDVLMAELARVAARFEGRPVVRPEFWSGFEVIVQSLEFWHDREDRLHDRVLYERRGDRFQAQRLAP